MSTSRSSAGEQSLATLTAEGPPGVEIQVIDGQYRIVARGTEELKLQLADGVYLMRWLIPGYPQEQIVRLLPKADPVHVVLPDAPSHDIARQLQSSHVLSRIRARRLDSTLESAIIVLEKSESESEKSSIPAELSVFNSEDLPVLSNTMFLDAMRPDLTGGWGVAVYDVTPGSYRLRYNSSKGMSLDQTVVAIAGRRTLVYLSREVAETLVSAADAYERHAYEGVAPDKTVIISVPLAAVDLEPEALWLADVLLQALAEGGDALDVRLLQRLRNPAADPLLRMYAATLIVFQLSRRSSPALDDPYPVRSSAGVDTKDDNETAFRKRWEHEARRLLESIGPLDLASDLVVLQSQLANAPLGGLSAPPMLVVGWEGAAAASATSPGAIPDSPNFRGAARGRVSAGPWLVWRASAAKEAMIAEIAPAEPDEEVDQLITSFSANLSALREAGTENRLSMEALERFSGSTRGLIATTLRLEADSVERDQTEQLASLASELLTPVPQLKARLEKASREIEQSTRQLSLDTHTFIAEELEGDAPPALRRPILHFDDPQKGRFGGRSHREGFRIEASFSNTGNPRWVGVNLVVSADADINVDAQNAEFFLHDTFPSPRVVVPFSDSAAELHLEAFGGFTVGVWMPSHGVQLELDLSELEAAPRIIKEW